MACSRIALADLVDAAAFPTDGSYPFRNHGVKPRHMSVRIVRLGSPRAAGEGLRIGTVRRPPRGVAKTDFAKADWYDVWYPNLAPSAELVASGKAATTPGEWAAFSRAYRKAMGEPEASRTLDLLAALSHSADFSVGCYREDEGHCHRSLLRELLRERGARIAD